MVKLNRQKIAMNNKMQADQILKKQLENVGDLQIDEDGKTFKWLKNLYGY